MENYQPRVVKCSNLIVIILVFISTEADCKGVSVKNAGIMIPNVRQREIEAGATFDITCTFLHTSAIEWKLPDYLTIYKNLSNANERLTIQHVKNNTHVTSTLKITGAKSKDTGTYSCFLALLPQQKTEQYVYVYSKSEPIIFDDNDRLVFPLGGIGMVPCKPTHPNISISLLRKNLLSIQDIPVADLKQNLLTSKGSAWLQDPKSGLLLTKVTLNDFGSYQCKALNNSKAVHFRIVVSGVELTRGSQDDVIEGDNITLVCRAYLFPSPPKWTYIDSKSGQMKTVNVTHPPQGIRVETEQVNGTGETLPIFKSKLFLTNVGMDSPNNFSCSATGNDEGEDRIYKEQLSFRITNSIAFE